MIAEIKQLLNNILMQKIAIVLLLSITFVSGSSGENILKDNFTNKNEWTYIADR